MKKIDCMRFKKKCVHAMLIMVHERDVTSSTVKGPYVRPKLFSVGITFLGCCLKYDFMRQLRHDVRFIVCIMYRVTWLFPDQYSYFVCCGLHAIYYECTHDGDMLCITGTTH